MTFFNNNARYLSSEASAATEFDVLVAYLMDETKKDNIRLKAEYPNPVNGGTTVTLKFNNGDEFIFDRDEKAIYFSNDYKYFVVARNIGAPESTSVFTTNLADGNLADDKHFTVNVKISEKEYSQTFTIEDN